MGLQFAVGYAAHMPELGDDLAASVVNRFGHGLPAVHVLLRWYRAGVPVQSRLPVLAASMGHVSVASTAHYLALIEPLAQAASDLFAPHCRSGLPSLADEGGGR